MIKDKFGFKNYGDNGLEKYSSLANKRVSQQNTSVSDLFKDRRTMAQKKEDQLKEELRSMQNSYKPTKEMLMSAEELELLGNSNKLTKLFENSRYKFVSSLDNAECKEIDVQYSNKGAYIVNMDNSSLFFNEVSKIESVDYVPGCVMAKSNYMLRHTTYNIYVKHQYSNENILVARLVFAE